MENFKGTLDNIDGLLKNLDGVESVSTETLRAIDGLCDEVEEGFENRTTEIQTMSVDRKRSEVMGSADTHLLNQLSMDENFNVRTLAACNPDTPIASLERMIEGSNDYIRMVIANNPSTPTRLLDRIYELSSGVPEVVDAVMVHPNISEKLQTSLKFNKL